MAGADVGGDGSVKWRVWGDNVRNGSVKNNPHGKGHEQGAIDETDDGKKFTICIKIPTSNQADFADGLAAAAAAVRTGTPGALVCFLLPIEKSNEDQIQIRWDSRVDVSPAPVRT